MNVKRLNFLMLLEMKKKKYKKRTIFRLGRKKREKKRREINISFFFVR